jgi:hypothetical protein
MARDAQRAQAAVDNRNRNALRDATPEERAYAERYHRLRHQCALESLERFALLKIVDDLGAPPEHRAVSRADLDRREAEFQRLLAEAP